MSGGDVTIGFLKRLTDLLAGQDKFDVDITGGTIANVALVDIDSITLDNPLPIVSGGTEADNASDARTNLGVEIGVDVQAYSVNLDTYSNLTFSTDVTFGSPSDTETASSLAIKTYVDTEIANVNIPDGDKGDITTSGSGATWLINSDAVTYDKMQDTTGTDVILGRETAGAGTVEEISCTAAGRAILDDATAADQRTTLGLGSIATQDSSSVTITGGSITGITDLAIADGGTGASTAADARTNLDVYSTGEVDALFVGRQLIGITQFTAGGTWTKPADCNAVYVICVGGGGEGESSGGTTGAAGGTSSFGLFSSATGGEGGQSGNNGGLGIGGDRNYEGSGAFGIDGADTPRGYGFGGKDAAGINAINFGAGGSGGTTGGSIIGGASGGVSETFIDSGLGVSETIQVGAGGAGTTNGGDGSDGIVIVWEYS